VKTISKLSLPITVLVGLYLLISGNLFSLNPFLIVQALAIAVLPWARRSFQAGQFNIHADPKGGQLISSGPYKFIRHPMYASVLVIIWSGILSHFSLPNLILGVVVTVVVAIRIFVEEQSLRETYPEYVDFSRKSKLVIPFIL
jgi:protein-S-isoprenylcysteine O-methyltransferase Ste14